MLTVLGLSFIVSLAGRNLLKGFIMAAFGFLLAMVGLDPQSSIQRFTFGQLYLWEGINVVPVVVGLFGGAEVLQLMMTKGSIAHAARATARLAGVMQGVRDTFEHWWLTLRASAIGVGIGVIPGHGRRRLAVHRLRPRAADVEAPGDVRQGQRRGRDRGRRGEQFARGRQPDSDGRVRDPRQRLDGDPAERLPAQGPGAGAGDADHEPERHLLDGLGHRALEHHRGLGVVPVPQPARPAHAT